TTPTTGTPEPGHRPPDPPAATPSRDTAHPRPTSLRGRAARRRRRSDTATPGAPSATGESDAVPPYPHGPSGARPRRWWSGLDVGRRRSLLLAGIAGLTVIGITLA